MFSVTIMALTASVLISGISMNQERRYVVAGQIAREVAESGVHAAVLRVTDGVETIPPTGLEFSKVFEGTGTGAKRFDVVIVPAIGDGIDNNGNGQVDEDIEANLFEVTSRGSHDRVRRTLHATVSHVGKLDVRSIMHFQNDEAILQFDGNSFTISGEAVDLAGNPTGEVTQAIAVVGEAHQILAQIDPTDVDNLTGSPLVASVPPVDVDAIVEMALAKPHIEVRQNSTVQMANPGDWGTVSKPAIIHGYGEVGIASGAVGAGILIVDGDLVIKGGFEWTGLIIVRGTVDFRGGGSTQRVVGGMVVADAVGTPSGKPAAQIGGTADLVYSPAALNVVRNRINSRFAVVRWRSGRTEEGTSAP
jgi:hypothetical protein